MSNIRKHTKFENYKDLVERLNKEGSLNEIAYSLLVTHIRKKIIGSTVLVIILIITCCLVRGDYWVNYAIQAVILYSIYIVFNNIYIQRSNTISRLCGIYTFGIKAEAKVEKVLLHSFGTLGEKSVKDFNYEFFDESEKYTQGGDSILYDHPEYYTKVGEFIQIIYSPAHNNDSCIFNSMDNKKYNLKSKES